MPCLPYPESAVNVTDLKRLRSQLSNITEVRENPTKIWDQVFVKFSVHTLHGMTLIQKTPPQIISLSHYDHFSWLLRGISLGVYCNCFNFFPTHRTLWHDRKFFPSRHVSHWWTISTATFVDASHTGMRHQREKFYCRTVNSKVDTVTASL